MKEEALFDCFSSKALIGGEVVLIGKAESLLLWKAAIRQGLLAPGVDGRDANWKIRLVMFLRSSFTAAHYDHEWWGAQTFLPEWARRVQEVYLHDWRYFPKTPEELNARKLGAKIGYSLTMGELMVDKVLRDEAFREQWERREFENAIQGQEDMADRTRIIYPGFQSSQEMLEAGRESALVLRKEVASRAASEATPEEHADFIGAYAEGAANAKGKLPEQLAAYEEQTDVASILVENAVHIERHCENRTEVNLLVRRNLPKWKREFLEDETHWLAFTERMRERYEKVGLKKRGRGRPKKIREIE